MQVKMTERGWPGHFICASRCTYRRNTLIEACDGTAKVVVSTVGGMLSRDEDEIETIGSERYYETMAFHASLEGGYFEADVSRDISLNCSTTIGIHSYETDKLAEDMHRHACEEVARRMKVGEFEAAERCDFVEVK